MLLKGPAAKETPTGEAMVGKAATPSAELPDKKKAVSAGPAERVSEGAQPREGDKIVVPTAQLAHGRLPP